MDSTDKQDSKEENLTNNQINETGLTEKQEKQEVGEVPKRFVIVVVYFLLNFANGLSWITYAANADAFRINFGHTRTQVDLLSMIFMIIYPIACIPDAYIIDNISVRLGLNLAAGTTILGCFIRLFTEKSYAFAIIGQAIASSFQPAIVNSPAKIACVWFKDESRALVTSICSAANMIGVLFGYIFHTFFIKESSEGDKYKKEFKNYLIGELILIAVFCIPTFIFMQNRPSIATSKSQEEVKTMALKENLRLLFTNANFIKFLICTSLVIGFFNIIGTTLNHFLALYDISDSEATITAGVANGVGLVACLVVSTILDKSKKFKKCMVILNIVGLFFFIILTVLFEEVSKGKAVISVIFYTLIFSSVISIFTTGLDYVAELTYPVGESFSGGVIMCCNQIVGALGIVFVDYLIDHHKDKKYLTNVLFCIMLFFSLISVSLVKEKLLRTEKERSGDEKEEAKVEPIEGI